MTNIYPPLYAEFIESMIGKTEIDYSDLDKLFSLHNNFVDLYNPESNKACNECIKKVWDKVKEYYNLDNVQPGPTDETTPEPEPQAEPEANEN